MTEPPWLPVEPTTVMSLLMFGLAVVCLLFGLINGRVSAIQWANCIGIRRFNSGKSETYILTSGLTIRDANCFSSSKSSAMMHGGAAEAD